MSLASSLEAHFTPEPPPAPSNSRIRVLLVDDSVDILSALTIGAQRYRDLEVVATLTSQRDLLTEAKTHKPSVIVLGLSHPRRYPQETIAQLHRFEPNIKIVVFSQALPSKSRDNFFDPLDDPQDLRPNRRCTDSDIDAIYQAVYRQVASAI